MLDRSLYVWALLPGLRRLSLPHLVFSLLHSGYYIGVHFMIQVAVAGLSSVVVVAGVHFGGEVAGCWFCVYAMVWSMWFARWHWFGTCVDLFVKLTSSLAVAGGKNWMQELWEENMWFASVTNNAEAMETQ
jgi:hypothetical protein